MIRGSCAYQLHHDRSPTGELLFVHLRKRRPIPWSAMCHDLPLATLDRDELIELRSTVRAAAVEAGYPAAVRELEGSEHRARRRPVEAAVRGHRPRRPSACPSPPAASAGLAELLAVTEELGATLAPVPFVSSTVLCGQVLAACGDAARAVPRAHRGRRDRGSRHHRRPGPVVAGRGRLHERRLVGLGHRPVRALRRLRRLLRRRRPHRRRHRRLRRRGRRRPRLVLALARLLPAVGHRHLRRLTRRPAHVRRGAVRTRSPTESTSRCSRWRRTSSAAPRRAST